MKIGIDIDGVISNFAETFIDLAKKRYGVILRSEDIRTHDLFQVLGVRQEEAQALIKETVKQDLNVMPGAKESLEQLRKHNKIFLLTTRPEETKKTTQQWLHRREIPYDKLVYLAEGNKYRSKESLDIVIDDNLLEAIRCMGKVSKIIIFDHPWNKSLDVHKSFIRVYSWRDILDTLDI